MARIQHSNMLGRAYRSFANTTKPLLIYGHSLAGNDEHILHLIDIGKMNTIFIRIFGDPYAHADKNLLARGKEISTRRRNRTSE